MGRTQNTIFRGSSLSVDRMVLHRIPEQRRWVETVFTVVKFLAINGISFRGDVENTNFCMKILVVEFT